MSKVDLYFGSGGLRRNTALTALKPKGVSQLHGLYRGGTQEISQRSILSGKYIFEAKKYFLKSQKSI